MEQQVTSVRRVPTRLLVVALVAVLAVGALGAARLRATAASGEGPVIVLTASGDQPPHRCEVLGQPRRGSVPRGAVVVRPGTSLSTAVEKAPAGTTFVLSAGTHTLGSGRYDQVRPKDGDRFLGLSGAVLDGRRTNQYAFGGHATDVTISGLTVRRFGKVASNRDEGVVNHDSGARWSIVNNTITDNAGAGTMLGDENVLRGNCLSRNGQYGFNAYRGGDGITDLVVTGNEITGNNTDDWERKVEGCGCTGGGKFWAVRGADVSGNYVHDNAGAGLWADTDDTGFSFVGNYLADNDAEGIFYEISYNAQISDNTFVRNGWVKGPKNGGFPTAALYLSESGSDPRVPGDFGDRLEVSGNLFVDNWSGVVGYENADRYAGSSANTSSGYTTLVNPDATLAACRDTSRGTRQPLFDDCRWRTQGLDVHDNDFRLDAASVPRCTAKGYCGFNGLFANYGTYKPYQGTVVQDAIVADQDNRWHDNRYTGRWGFVLHGQGEDATWDQWRAAGFDTDSTRG